MGVFEKLLKVTDGGPLVPELWIDRACVTSDMWSEIYRTCQAKKDGTCVHSQFMRHAAIPLTKRAARRPRTKLGRQWWQEKVGDTWYHYSQPILSENYAGK